MKKIINGKMYNTDTARELATPRTTNLILFGKREN